jgi:hypothetical protein
MLGYTHHVRFVFGGCVVMAHNILPLPLELDAWGFILWSLGLV